MNTEPDGNAKRVYWAVDNGSSHRGRKAIARLTSAFSNAIMVHTPAHASWTNQIEIFRPVQRKVVSPNHFTDLTQVRNRLRASEDRYNATAQPFQRRFPTTDLDHLLARLDRHTLDGQQEEPSVAHGEEAVEVAVAEVAVLVHAGMRDVPDAFRAATVVGVLRW
ncbi:hypothetical protein ACIA78_31885 [Streptomyces xanthochromogenes]|uniref:hypothetical protein n=1 Tax=Streptomyces xanthochromogenes TaxID=67384 RepID=UPI003790E7E9